MAEADVFLVGLGLSDSVYRGVQKIRRAGKTDAEGRLSVPLVPGELSTQERAGNLPRWFEPDNPPAQAKSVHVVVFHSLVR